MQVLHDHHDTSNDVRIVLRPFGVPEEGIDVTEAVTNAIACEIERRHLGNCVLNRLEAEMLLVDFLQRCATRGNVKSSA